MDGKNQLLVNRNRSKIAGLVDRGHTVFAAVPEGSDSLLGKCSIKAWLWYKMQKGKKTIEKLKKM